MVGKYSAFHKYEEGIIKIISKGLWPYFMFCDEQRALHKVVPDYCFSVYTSALNNPIVTEAIY